MWMTVILYQFKGHGERVVQRDRVVRYLRDVVLKVQVEDLLLMY